MKHRSVLALTFITLAVVGPRLHAAVSVPLTIQEALYPGGVGGVLRTAEPVSVGIPLPDDAATGATNVSELTLTGATAGQFRVLGRWPSGRIKWVLVDTLASLSAGSTTAGIALTTGGSGNFGGSDLATDNGATITVATGTATFTIRKANFNGFQQVVVGGTTVVAAGASTGLVVTGPAPGNTTCGPCTTVYSSANDASSTAVIEENGPVRTVIKATGSHKDASGNAYMKFTVRMHFYKNLSRVKAVTTLRNADYGPSNSFASAAKGYQGYEWRIAPTLTGTPTYEIAKHGGAIESGTLPAATDDVYLYQGASDWLKHEHWGCCGTVPYTTDTGYSVVKNGSNLATGTATQYPTGWADIRGTTNGAGVSIGVYQLAAYWSKSLEFSDAGSDVRIGIWPRQNSQPYYQAWPQWSTHDLYFNFHASALTNPANEFLKFQHALLGRASRTHYNTTAVFPYPIVDPAVEDAFYASVHSTANPVNNFPFVPPVDASPAGTQLVGNGLRVYRVKSWQAGGESNQQEFRWSWLLNYIQRGFTGRYLNAAHFYRFQTDDVAPHSDGFSWRDYPAQTDSFGRPQEGYTTSLNMNLTFRSWFDQEHMHWYGMTDFYFMSGDETVKDAILDGYADWHLDDSAYQAGDFTGLFDSRADGVNLLSAARMATFLKAIGNTADATTVLNNAADLFNEDVKKVLCTSAEQASQGCTTGPAHGGPWPDEGTSRTRGVVWSGGGVGSWCGTSYPNGLRLHSTWNSGAFVQQGLMELSDAKGPGWSDYWVARDLAYGMSQGNDGEAWRSLGNGRWDQDGWRVGITLDIGGNCPTPPPAYDQEYWNTPAMLSHWMTHYTRYRVEGSTNWIDKVRIAMLKAVNYTGTATADFYGYQLGAVIAAFSTPPTATLNPVAITSVVPNGGGSYTISWVVPAGTQSYRIKWGSKKIVDWIGFNAATNTFIGNPATTMAWFAATNVPTLPTPSSPGTTQSLTIATGTTGLTVENFSVKAYVGSGSPTPPPPAGATLALAGGNNQTGTVGTTLTTPLAAKVSDSNGNPLTGVSVTFNVTGGGGILTTSSMATNSAGLAWTFLTLGAVPGTNAVTATSGALAGSPVTFTAVGTNTQSVNITPNRWVNVTPTYQGAPDGGTIFPMSWNNMGVYDPVSKRTISFDRWNDPVRSYTIYADALLAYDPASNTTTVLKLNNWLGSNPLPANTADPTPIDRHPFGGLALSPNANAVYLVNGANQTARQYYPDHPNDTWKFSLATRTWSKVSDPIANPSTIHPPSDVSTYSGMVYDPPTGKLVYFVTDYNGSGTTTWLFDTNLNLWSKVPRDPSSANVHISIAGIAYDSRRSVVLAYGGGYNTVSAPSTKLWSYSVGQNKWTTLPDAPVAASAPEFAYDSVHDIFLALVGQATLIYNPRTSAWSLHPATIERGPNPRQNVTYNPAQDVFVFQGGSWDQPVWSLFRYSDGASPPPPLLPPLNLRIIR